MLNQSTPALTASAAASNPHWASFVLDQIGGEVVRADNPKEPTAMLSLLPGASRIVKNPQLDWPSLLLDEDITAHECSARGAKKSRRGRG